MCREENSMEIGDGGHKVGIERMTKAIVTIPDHPSEIDLDSLYLTERYDSDAVIVIDDKSVENLNSFALELEESTKT